MNIHIQFGFWVWIFFNIRSRFKNNYTGRYCFNQSASVTLRYFYLSGMIVEVFESFATCF